MESVIFYQRTSRVGPGRMWTEAETSRGAAKPRSQAEHFQTTLWHGLSYSIDACFQELSSLACWGPTLVGQTH